MTPFICCRSLFQWVFISGQENVEVGCAGVPTAAAVADGAEGETAASNTITAGKAGPEAGGQSSTEVSEQPLSVGYFKELLSSSDNRLDVFCKTWEAKLSEAGLPEDIDGRVRAAIGNARILMGRKGRFFQFSELIGDCEFQRGENKTNLEDLQVCLAFSFHSRLMLVVSSL